MLLGVLRLYQICDYRIIYSDYSDRNAHGKCLENNKEGGWTPKVEFTIHST